MCHLKLNFNGRLSRDILLDRASDIGNLTAPRAVVDAKKYALSSTLRFQPEVNVGIQFLFFICVHRARLDLCVRTTFSRSDPTTHMNLGRYPSVSSSRASLTNSGSEKPPLTSSMQDSSSCISSASLSANVPTTRPIVTYYGFLAHRSQRFDVWVGIV